MAYRHLRIWVVRRHTALIVGHLRPCRHLWGCVTRRHSSLIVVHGLGRSRIVISGRKWSICGDLYVNMLSYYWHMHFVMDWDVDIMMNGYNWLYNMDIMRMLDDYVNIGSWCHNRVMLDDLYLGMVVIIMMVLKVVAVSYDCKNYNDE